MPTPDPNFSAFVATDDHDELGIKAGDCFMWDYGPDGARLVQIRQWKNAATLLSLYDQGLLEALPDAPLPGESRQAVGGRSGSSGGSPVRLVE